MKKGRWNIAIVGAGIVGQTLGRVLYDQGEKIVAIISRSQRSARKGGAFLHCKNASTSLEAIPVSTDLVLIATPHDAVADVASNLAKLDGLDFKRLAVCHASGMLTAEVLAPLRSKKATVFSFHPLQTFPRDFSPRKILDSIPGIYYGVDGNPGALRVANRLAQKLDGDIVNIPPEMRELYHAACVVASNHLTTMMWQLSRMYEQTGAKAHFFNVFKPIVLATLENISRSSPAKALTGPVARGGPKTVEAHFKAVKKQLPDLLPFFSTLTIDTVKLALAKGSIDKAKAKALVKIARSYKNHSHLREIQ